MKTFVCALCGLVCESPYPDEDARREYRERWGHEVTDSTPVVCDECYRAIESVTPPIPSADAAEPESR